MTDAIQRIPPYSECSEQALLGSIMRESEVLEHALARGCMPEWFYVPAHRTIYETILRMQAEQKAIDLVTVHDALGDDAERVGGFVAVSACVDAALVANSGTYIAAIQQAWMKRRCIALARQLEAESYKASCAEELRAKYESELANICTRQDEQSTAAVVADLVEKMELGAAGEPVDLGVLSTGLYTLDDVMEGGYHVGATWLAAKAKCGKTTMADHSVLYHIDRNLPTASISLEMSKAQRVERLMNAHAHINVARIVRGRADYDPQAVADTAKLLSDERVLRIETNVRTLAQIRGYCHRMVKKHGVKFIVIDYLQRISLDGINGDTSTQKLDNLCGGLVDIANTLAVPILCISSLSNEGNLRGSGQIAYDGVATLRLERIGESSGLPDYKSTIRCHIEQQRFGPSGIYKDLTLHGRETRFEDKERT